MEFYIYATNLILLNLSSTIETLIIINAVCDIIIFTIKIWTICNIPNNTIKNGIIINVKSNIEWAFLIIKN